ncbi:MAG: UvrD-helicase domain-containing protein [Patescibacteria group bacterium]
MGHFLDELNDPQRDAVVTMEGPLLVIAGAGSGKTKALTHRIAYMIQERGVSPWNILAVTFTNKAAQEMKERIAKLTSVSVGQSFMENLDLPTIGTFHSVCVKILRKYGHVLGYENSFTIYDGTDQEILMKQLMEQRKMDPKKMNPKAILGGISGAKNQLITAKEYQKYANSHFTETIAELYPPYQKALRENGAMDFDDLIMNVVTIFRTDAAVLTEYQDRFGYISVDEYQDTNHAQYTFSKLLAEKYRNICAIGDEDQSIYSWRGATIRNILDFEKDYPEAKVIKLEQNYRSTQPILDAAHSVIRLNSQRKEKKLWTEKTIGDPVKIWACRNERAEGEMVAQEILKTMRTYEAPDYQDFVVLYRTNAQSRVMEEIFLRNGIPYKIIGGIKFYDRKEIKDLIAYLRVIQNPRDSVSMMRILNVPARNIGAKTIEAVQQFALSRGVSFFEAMDDIASFGELADAKVLAIQKFVALIRRLQNFNTQETAAGMIKYVFEEAGYRAFLDDGSSEGEERLENVREMISVAKKYDALEPGMSLKIFLEEVSLIADAERTEEKKNSVTMMTIHSAKGLEFPVVFVVGMEEGIFPHGRNALERDLLEEERRLMYVAVTRAKEKLYLLFAQERMLYGEYKNNPPSQFLAVLPEDVVERNYDLMGGRGRVGGFGGAGVSTFGSSGGRQFQPITDLSQSSKPVPMEDVESVYQKGDTVMHPSFGPGTVMSVAGGVIEIIFEDPDVGVKKLAVSIAPLKKIAI